MLWWIVVISAAALSWLCTWRVRSIATVLEIVDRPGPERKIHREPIPLWGGLAIFTAFVAMVAGYLSFSTQFGWPALIDAHVEPMHVLGILGGALWLVIGGMLDDKYTLKPKQQIIWPVLAALTVIGSGIGIEKITNPLGGYIVLNHWQILLWQWDDTFHVLTPWADLFTLVWLVGAIYTTKLLDGLDGLVSGITVIGATTIALLSIFFFVNTPTALLALMVAGVYAGFLVWNFHPAKIFLGEAGSTLAGYFLGVLALISGAKVATTVLVLGIAILDAAWVIGRRLSRRQSPFTGDRSHLHFRLLTAGLSQRQAVLLLYAVAASFGGAALFLQSAQKAYALILIPCIMILIGLGLWMVQRRRPVTKAL